MKIRHVLVFLLIYHQFAQIMVNALQKIHVHVLKDGQILNVKILFVLDLFQLILSILVLVMVLVMVQIIAFVKMDMVVKIVNTLFVEV